MELTAITVPYSSMMGGSLTLIDEQGEAQFTIMFGGTTRGITKDQSRALCERIGRLINEHGLLVPAHEDKPYEE